MAKEGVRSFFKGAGANILRGVAGAGVLSIYDQGWFPHFIFLLGYLTYRPSATATLWQGFQRWFRIGRHPPDIIRAVDGEIAAAGRSPVTMRQKECRVIE